MNSPELILRASSATLDVASSVASIVDYPGMQPYDHTHAFDPPEPPPVVPGPGPYTRAAEAAFLDGSAADAEPTITIKAAYRDLSCKGRGSEDRRKILVSPPARGSGPSRTCSLASDRVRRTAAAPSRASYRQARSLPR